MEGGDGTLCKDLAGFYCCGRRSMTLVFILLIGLHPDQHLFLPTERFAENLEHLPNIHLLNCGHYSHHLVLSYAEHSLSHC